MALGGSAEAAEVAPALPAAVGGAPAFLAPAAAPALPVAASRRGEAREP